MLAPYLLGAQTYDASLLRYREAYKMSLLKGWQPLKPEDTAFVRFFEPDEDYCVKATFEQITGTAPFMMPSMHTSYGPQVKDYGIVYFSVKGAPITLHVFRLLTKPHFRIFANPADTTPEHTILFIPFTDRSNYKETFKGGRCIDVSAADLAKGKVIIDFNKAYNPHTAYEKGYPYIIPPDNAIMVEINAGEKKFGRNPGY